MSSTSSSIPGRIPGCSPHLVPCSAYVIRARERGVSPIVQDNLPRRMCTDTAACSPVTKKTLRQCYNCFRERRAYIPGSLDRLCLRRKRCAAPGPHFPTQLMEPWELSARKQATACSVLCCLRWLGRWAPREALTPALPIHAT